MLEGRGVDLFMVETFYDLDELDRRDRGGAQRLALPIVALLTFDEGAETLAGVTAQEAAERLRRARRRGDRREPRRRAPAALEALEQMRATARRSRRCRTSASRASPAAVSSIPHATPEYFAEFAAQAREPRRAR